jgi:hypothetical protein
MVNASQAKGRQVQGSQHELQCNRGNKVGPLDLVLSFLELTTSSADDSLKGSAFIAEALLDPATSHSEEPSDSPALRLFKKKSYFEYLYAPGNEYLHARLQAAMVGLAAMESSAVVPGGFPWETLPEGTKIVDVGGGSGSASQEIMKKNPSLKFTVQDLPNVTKTAIAVRFLMPMSNIELIYSRRTRSTGITMSPRRSPRGRSQSKRTISSLLSLSRTRTYSYSGTSYTTGRTEKRLRFSND